MAEERGKPFVGWMDPDGVRFENGFVHRWGLGMRVPVVVTPLLPTDPRVGETWLSVTGRQVTILAGPFEDGTCPGRVCAVAPTAGGAALIADVDTLRRPPVLRTVTLTLTEEEARSVREIAAGSPAISPVLAKLSDALEEVD